MENQTGRPAVFRWTLFLAISSCAPDGTTAPATDSKDLTPLAVFEQAFRDRISDLPVTQEGALVRILADDTAGDRHQRMIVKMANGQTLLIAHNIDLAARVPDPAKGRMLRFGGEYVYNDEGGLVHWTHRDPAGAHADGWLEYEGARYW